MRSKPQIELFPIAAHTLRYLGKRAEIFPFGIYSNWKHLLPEIFHEHFSETEILNSIDHSFKEKWTEEKIISSIKKLEDKSSLSELILLYLELVKKSDNLIAYKKLKAECKSLFESENFKLSFSKEIKETIEVWLEKNEKKSFRPIISVPVSLYIIFLDFTIRFILLYLRNSGTPTLAGTPFAIDFTNNTSFVLTNVFIVPAIVGVLGYLYNRKNRSATTKTLNTLNLSHIKITPSISAWDYFIVGCMAIIGIGIAELAVVNFTEGKALIFFFLSFIMLMYLLLILRFFSLPAPTSTMIYHKLKERDQIEVDDDLSSDDNDIEIVNLEVRLRSLTEKMNAFVIEAALFGALAFSGFIQVIAAEIFELQAFSEFNSTIIELARGFITGNTENLSASFNALLHRNTLLSLLCYESLFCSICFLSVIASRMRFSDLTDMLDKALALSKNFNEKEEGLILHQNHSRESDKVVHYSNLIRFNLQKGLKDYNKIKPVLEYMRFFRTLGIGSFFIIIITGGLFISPFVSLLFSIIFVLSLIYFKFPILAANFMEFKTRVQEFRSKVERSANWFFVAVLIMVTIYRTFYLPYSGYLLLLITVLIAVHQLMLIIEGKTFSFSNKIFTRIFRFGVLVLFLGLGFKSTHFPGASLLLFLGTFLLIIFFSFHPIRTKKTLIIKGLSISMAIAILGLLFKIQHYPGATMLKNIGLIGIVISSGLSFYKHSYKSFPPFYKWFLGIASGLALLIIPFHGAGYRMISSLNVDIVDLKKFHEFEEWRINLSEIKENLREKNKPIDFSTDINLQNSFNDPMNGELTWLKTESILGFYTIDWLSDYYYYFNNQKGDESEFTKAQLYKLIEFTNQVESNCKNENPQYLQYHSKELQEIFEFTVFQKAYFFYRLNEIDSASKYLSVFYHTYDGKNSNLWADPHKKLEQLIQEKLKERDSSFDTTNINSLEKP